MNPVVTAALLEAGFLWMAFAGDLRAHLPILWSIVAIQFVALFLTFRQAKVSVPFMLVMAGLFRLTLLGTTPSLSDDLYRYAWEGRIQHVGVNPYRDAPAAAALEPYRNAVYPRINHKAVPSVYPPFTMAAFRAGSYLSDFFHFCGLAFECAEVLGQKCLFVAFDWLTLLALRRWLRVRRLPESRALWYAWNPLVILEIAGSGHNDALGIFFWVAAVGAWESQQWIRAALTLGASILSKYFAVLLLPALAWQKRWRELAVLCLFVAAAVVPFTLDGGVLSGTQAYVGEWRFNESICGLLLAGTTSAVVAKASAAVLLALLAVGAGRKSRDIGKQSFLVIAGALLLMPTVHPWYFLWLVPFLCIQAEPAFMVWNATILLSYAVWPRFSASGLWQLPVWARATEYAPVFALFFWKVARR
jgi:alpha-1,6-mannosyltransferase